MYHWFIQQWVNDCYRGLFSNLLKQKLKLNAFFSESLKSSLKEKGQCIHIQVLIKWHWQCNFPICKTCLPGLNFSLIEMSLKNSTNKIKKEKWTGLTLRQWNWLKVQGYSGRAQAPVFFFSDYFEVVNAHY